jgi:hypothetical protein
MKAEDEAKGLPGVWTHLGGGAGGASHASPEDCRCGQGSFLSVPFAA